jgi:hypothetical protein
VKKIGFLTVFILRFVLIFAQGEVDTTKKIFFRNEKTFEFKLNSNGWGINYRYAKRIDAARKFMYDGDMNIMKNSKEYKQYSENPTSTRFVYGKLNYVVCFRTSVGRQRELFRKFDRGSVSIRIFESVGGTVAVLKPIYYQVLNLTTGQTENLKFDKTLPSFQPVGLSPVYMGLSELKFIPGVFVKVGASFEFSKRDNKMRALEAGFCFDAYPKKIEIMATTENSALFPTVYVSFRFGRVVSGYHLKDVDEGKIPDSKK